MASGGVPVRLSEALATRARSVAEILDRSLTEQVEHWARLGQVVEAVVATGTVHQLKSHSHDPQLAKRLDVVDTPAGRAKAAKLIRQRNPVRYGADAAGSIVAGSVNGKRASKRK